MLTGRIKVDVGRTREGRLPYLNSDARRRSTAGRVINNGVRMMIREIQNLADAELREERPDDRRRTEGPRYRDSFLPLVNTQKSIDKLEGGFKSTHHFARGLEKGTGRHDIWGRPARPLRFPFIPNATRSQRGGPPGNWPILYAKGNRRADVFVDHPGTPAFQFVARARRKYRQSARGRGSRPSVSSSK